MRGFKNILVGIDLSQGDRFVSNELPPPTVEAIERALWLAKLNSARLTFFSALDISAAAQEMIEKSAGGEVTILDDAQEVLGELVARAAAEGVSAGSDVQFGKSWMELIRQVLRNKHDLVVAGTRHLGSLKGLLLGSTGIKLLRKCPCAVWITQPQKMREIQSILVAHDLQPVGASAMELGCAMAELHGAQLHVLHSVDFPELRSVFPEHVGAEKSVEMRAKAQESLEAQVKGYEFAQPPQIHVVTDAPEHAILERIEQFEVELLVMGTIARTGVTGFFVGNTAERLLPRIPCSVLAVKPEGFVSTVKL